MKKKIGKMLSLLAVFGLLLLVFGCTNNTVIDNTIPIFTVTFISHDQEVLGTFSVESGAAVSRPFSNPSREGWTFTDWFNQATGGAVFDFSTPITENTTIWARWAAMGEEVTVTFMLHGGSWGLADNTAKVRHGDPVGEPTEKPARNGFFFDGWFTAAVGGNKWNFDTPIVADTTLWAQWSPAVRVTFDLAGGNWTHPEYIDIPQGTTLENIPAPAKSGRPGFQGLFNVPANNWTWTFEDWQNEGNEWLLTAPVQGNMNLIARWTSPYGPKSIPDEITTPFESTNFIHRAFDYMNEHPGEYYLILNEDITVPVLRPTGITGLLAGDVLRNSKVTLIGLGEMRTISRRALSGFLFFVTDDGEMILGENIAISGDDFPSTHCLILVDGEDARLEMLAGSRITGFLQAIAAAGFNAPVVVRNDALFTMRGGEITGNRITIGSWSSGGVLCISGGNFIMEDGKIFGNTAFGARGGGAVHIRLVGSSFTMNNGEIFDNISGSGSDAAAVVADQSPIFTMNNGRIFNNTGGGVAILAATTGHPPATFNMNGGEISGNTATVNFGSGGVNVEGGAIFNMNAGQIFNNTANGNTAGGAITIFGGSAVNHSTVNMRGGSIWGNIANGTNSAGAVFINQQAHSNWLRISDGIIYGSNAPVDRRNISMGAGGAAVLRITAPTGANPSSFFEHGTWIEGVWTPQGSIGVDVTPPAADRVPIVRNETIHVIEGVLQP